MLLWFPQTHSEKQQSSVDEGFRKFYQQCVTVNRKAHAPVILSRQAVLRPLTRYTPRKMSMAETTWMAVSTSLPAMMANMLASTGCR